ncbi:MAG TPA: universal stress protein, partial [Thermoanaerobaculia bacterium]|nr:universal stress protein [Thermoanaerobaculia bacterium]
RTGYPWEEIVRVLEERRADLVVLGTHGRRGFEHLMVGSVATGVMHRVLYGLHAILRLHFAQEEEQYLPLLEDGEGLDVAALRPAIR